MPRYKREQYDQTKMIPIAFEQQLFPGTFEHALVYIVDNELDLSCFDADYRNDDTGRIAIHPGTLLKIVLLAYSRGITSSRWIEQLCRENVVFMAVSSDTQPHFTTIADFVSRSPEAIKDIFVQILLICDEQGLIGKEMFAIDGCKLPSNASKHWSGTHADLRKKADKLDKAVKKLVERHREDDDDDSDRGSGGQRQIEKLQASSAKIKQFLTTNEKRMGRKPRLRPAKEVKSNITDNESVKMSTSHGVIQGYIGVAAVDAAHQIIVEASAYGQPQEHGLLQPSVDNAHNNLGFTKRQIRATKISADSGYHNEEALDYLETQEIDGYVADHKYRQRDVKFDSARRHKPKKTVKREKPKRFKLEDFELDVAARTCVCPAGAPMWLSDPGRTRHKRPFIRFRGYESVCKQCQQRNQCLKDPNQHSPRQVLVYLDDSDLKDRSIDRMKAKIDTEKGRAQYSRRMGIVEPVFGHLTHAIGIKRFSLRGERKVDGQWKLMASVINLSKLMRYGAIPT